MLRLGVMRVLDSEAGVTVNKYGELTFISDKGCLVAVLIIRAQ